MESTWTFDEGQQMVSDHNQTRVLFVTDLKAHFFSLCFSSRFVLAVHSHTRGEVFLNILSTF